MADVEDNNQKTGLLLIGIGPGDVALATSEALSAAKMADFRRYEAYTALWPCLLYTSPSPRDATLSRMPSSA